MNLYQYVREHPAGDPAVAPLLTCPRCVRPLPISEFYVARARSRLAEGRLRGSASMCRDCKSEGLTRYRAERVNIIDAHRAKGCADCGLVDTAHPEIFDFDHVRGTKVGPVSSFLVSGTVEGLLAEIAKCEVVCANCHRIRTRMRVSGKRGSDQRS